MIRNRSYPVLALLFAFMALGYSNCGPGFQTLQKNLASSAATAGDRGNAPICLFPSPCLVQKITKPNFQTEVVMFEDNFMFRPAPGVTDLIYRIEGAPQVTRSLNSLKFQGIGGIIHPAQFRKATLHVRISIVAGEPEIAFAHNGVSDNTGVANSTPGLKLVFKPDSTDLVDLSSGQLLTSLAEVVPRSSTNQIAVAWDTESKQLRIDLPKSSYALTVEKPIPAGGFAFRSSRSETDYEIKQIKAIWEDNRKLVLYDEYDTLHNLDGSVLQRINDAKLPAGTAIQTVLVDLKKARSFIFYGSNTNLNIENKATIQGFGVRDFATGNVDLFPAPINGCWPLQGGGGMDGFALVQSWTPPASLCWLDWNAYDRGDRANFVVPAPNHQGSGAQGSTFLGFHDPDSALDGSIARYSRITEAYMGVTHFTVHPNLARFASFSSQTVPPSPNLHSHTGPAALPTQLVVRDRDRAWYETWSFAGTILHTQSRGYNLFSNSDDWAGPSYPGTAPAEPYSDYANYGPSLTEPGKLWAPLILWTPNTQGAAGQSLHYLSVGDNAFVSQRTLAPMPVKEHTPIQILWP